MTPPADWPGWAERWLRRFTDADTAEAIIGDIAEALGDETALKHTVPPRRLVVEVLSATWVLVHDRWNSRRARTEGGSDMDSWSPTLRRAAALIGLAACLPAFLLVTGGVLQVLFGTPQVMRVLDQTIQNQDVAAVRFLRHPATVLGGLLIAGALNVLPLLRVGVSRHAGTMVGTLILCTRAGHLAVGSMAGLLLAVVMGYAFTENFRIVDRSAEIVQAAPSTSDGSVAATPSANGVIAPCPADWYVNIRPDDDYALVRTALIRVASADDGRTFWVALPRDPNLQPDCDLTPSP